MQRLVRALFFVITVSLCTDALAQGSYCDTVGPIVTVSDNGALQMRVLRCDGTAWFAEVDGGWTLYTFVNPVLPPTVTVFDVRYWDGFKVLTKQGHAWFYRSGAWIDGGTIPPVAPAPITPQTWTGAKKMFVK